MDNFQVILYVVIMIIWVIVQNARKKKLKQQKEAQKNFQGEDEFGETKIPESRSIIDEILKEIREEKGQYEEDYDDLPKPEKPKTFVKTYETEARSLEYPNSIKLLEERQRLADKKGIRFDSYKIGKPETDEEEENEYANLIFEDPDSPRKAIILSEILNRKHF